MKRLYVFSIRKKNVVLSLVLAVVVSAAAFVYMWDKFGYKSEILSASNFYGYDDTLPSKERYDEGKLAIVIDDFGQSRNGVKEMMSIERHMTFAVMPFLEFSESDAAIAHQRGYEVIVHLAMEPYRGKKSWLGPRPIMAGMDGADVRQIVMDAFDNVPFASGANIHMGSKASSEENIIANVLDVIKEKNLYFLDSRTSPKPVAKQIADSKGVQCYDRNVFLDGTQSKKHIKKKLHEAGETALKLGKAVAIGHVGQDGGKVTAEAISEMIPEFDDKNIELVFLSELGSDVLK
ncbi:MAG: divergent polysaccharide deacetylase family protein [Clostridia bacterium]|nr:divergent polysaccharide deacetylase family protein [Clostridia bacterium]